MSLKRTFIFLSWNLESVLMHPRFPPAIFFYSWRFLLGLQHLKIGQIWRKSNHTQREGKFNILLCFILNYIFGVVKVKGRIVFAFYYWLHYSFTVNCAFVFPCWVKLKNPSSYWTLFSQTRLGSTIRNCKNRCTSANKTEMKKSLALWI